MYTDFKIVDSNIDYTNINIKEFNNLEDIKEYRSWKNDLIILQVLVKGNIDNLASIELSNTKGINHRIYRVKKNLAYSKAPSANIPLDINIDRVKASDLLILDNKTKFIDDEILSFFIELEINDDFDIKDRAILSIKLTEENENKDIKDNEIKKDITINIKNKLVKEDNFDIELWQYPYRIAEYYNVDYFSDDHFNILKSHFKPYINLNSKTFIASLCEDAWGGQTYGEGDIKYPSMIKWELKDDKFYFDYTVFDKWVNFLIENKFTDKIIVYGIAPWHSSFTYYKDNKLFFEKFDPKSDRYKEVWNIFLKDFFNHLDKLDVFDMIYLGIDEQGFNKEIFNILDGITNKDGKNIKIAAAIDNYSENAKYADKIDHVSVSLAEYEKDRDRFLEFFSKRNKMGYTTMLYSCVGHKPGNFSLSHPSETYYTIISTYFCDGFLRWAYDAWTKDPLIDTTHRMFEPGDCFLVYPKDNVKESYIPNLSIRYLKIKEALKDVYKIRKIASKSKENKKNINQLFNSLNTKFVKRDSYLDNSELNLLLEDIRKIQDILY